MRKIGYILFAVVLSIFMLELKGQNTATSVRLDIVLNPILNLTVHPDQQNTTLEYLTLEDYRNGVEVTSPKQLSVFSTGPYVLNVRLADALYSKVSGEVEKEMYLPDVRISAIPVNGGNMRLESQSVTTAEKSLVYDDQPAFHKTFDLNYKGPGGNALVDFVNKSAQSTFTNTVLYSIEVR